MTEPESDPTQGLNTVLQELKDASNEEGKISVPDAYRLLHRWSQGPAYGGLSVEQFAEAVDVERGWYDALLKTAPSPNYWVFPVAMLGAWIVTAYFGRTEWALLVGGALLAGAGYHLGKRLGTRSGFDDGVGQGYKAAVLHAHGITPATEDAFWERYRQAREDRHMVEFLDKRDT